MQAFLVSKSDPTASIHVYIRAAHNMCKRSCSEISVSYILNHVKHYGMGL